MTATNLTALCRRWQEILRLRDWDVSITFARRFDIDDNKQGTVETILLKKLATIKILDPQDYSSEWMRPQNIEKTIVHELLHLHFMPIDTFEEGSPQATCIEQAIECISAALVALSVA